MVVIQYFLDSLPLVAVAAVLKAMVQPVAQAAVVVFGVLHMWEELVLLDKVMPVEVVYKIMEQEVAAVLEPLAALVLPAAAVMVELVLVVV